MRISKKPDGWKAIRFVITILVALVLSAGCRGSAEPTEPVEHTILLQGREVLQLEIGAGAIRLMGGGQQDQIMMQGQKLAGERMTFSTDTLTDRVVIRAQAGRRPFGGYRSPPLILTIIVPDNLTVLVESFEADFQLENFHGQMQLSTVAGNIQARNVQGEIALISARGDITVQQVTGQVRALAEHGAILLEEAHGVIGASTIMGSIRYTGRPAAGDEIRFEVDHGPVEILLPPEADLEVFIRSTSGEVVCLAPGLSSSARECQGTLGKGGAWLQVRTVSGNIALRLGTFVP